MVLGFKGLLVPLVLASGLAEERDLAPKRPVGSVRIDPDTHVPRGSSGCGKTSPYKAGSTTSASGTYAGVKRTFRVYVPSNYNPNTPMPIIIDHHGWTGSAAGEESGSGVKSQCSANGCIAVYPQGMADNKNFGSWASWNCVGTTDSPGPAGPTCASTHPTYCYTSCGTCKDTPQCYWTTCDNDVTSSGTGKSGVNGFIPSLYNTLESQMCIDTTREYATGMSNGGMMTFQLGASMGTRLAAIVPICGSFHNGFNEAPNGGVPVLATHGNRDTTVPANGTPPLGAGWYYTNMAGIYGGDSYSSGWKKANGCSGSSSHYTTPYDGQSSLYCIGEGSCSGGDVVRCAFSGGHTYAPSNGPLTWWFLSKFAKMSHIGGGLSEGDLDTNQTEYLENLRFDEEQEQEPVATSDHEDGYSHGKHYGDPAKGCLEDEDEIPLGGDGLFVGTVCAPRINSTKAPGKLPIPHCKLEGNAPFKNGCPKDRGVAKPGAWPICLDKGQTTTPYENGEFHCLLACGPCKIKDSSLDCGDDAHSQCPGRSMCIFGELRAVSMGVCGYPKHSYVV